MKDVLTWLALLILFSGCTYFGAKNTKLDKKIVQSTQDNVSKAEVSNDETIKNLVKTSVLFELDPSLKGEFPNLYQQVDYSLKSSNVTGSYLNRASSLIGRSELSPIEIRNEVLGLITNNQEYVEFARNQAQKESKLIGDKRENDDLLKGMGQIYEKERNDSIIQRVKFWGMIGGGVILAVLFFVYGWPLVSASGLVPMAMSLIPKKTLVKKIRASNTFLEELASIKKQEIDRGDVSKVRMLESVVQMFKDINRKEEDERDHKMTKEILSKNI